MIDIKAVTVHRSLLVITTLTPWTPLLLQEAVTLLSRLQLWPAPALATSLTKPQLERRLQCVSSFANRPHSEVADLAKLYRLLSSGQGL